MSDDHAPDEDRMQAQRRKWKRLDDLAAEIAGERATMETDIGKVLDEPKTPALTIKPGHHYYMAALRAGREDEYSDRMRARYGGEW